MASLKKDLMGLIMSSKQVLVKQVDEKNPMYIEKQVLSSCKEVFTIMSKGKKI